MREAKRIATIEHLILKSVANLTSSEVRECKREFIEMFKKIVNIMVRTNNIKNAKVSRERDSKAFIL